MCTLCGEYSHKSTDVMYLFKPAFHIELEKRGQFTVNSFQNKHSKEDTLLRVCA